MEVAYLGSDSTRSEDTRSATGTSAHWQSAVPPTVASMLVQANIVRACRGSKYLG